MNTKSEAQKSQESSFTIPDFLKTVAKNNGLANNQANDKNTQFLPNQADIQAILPTYELVIFTKFHDNWTEIVDFY